MGATAEVKFSSKVATLPDGSTVLGDDGRPVLVFDNEGQVFSVTLDEGFVTPSADSYLIWLDGMPSSGVAFYASGFKIRGDTSNITYPVRIDWKLYPSGSCIIENEPVWEGSTWIKSSDDRRDGMLVQTTGIDARAWFLWASLPELPDGVTLGGSMEFRCPRQPIIGGPLSATGSFVG